MKYSEVVMDSGRNMELLQKSAKNGNGSICRCEQIEQGWGTLARSVNLVRSGSLKVGDAEYAYGFGTHSPSRIKVTATEPLRYFRAIVGIERNAATDAEPDRISPAVFSVKTAEEGIEDAAEGFKSFSATGRQLMEHGITVTLPERRSSSLIFYWKKEENRSQKPNVVVGNF